MRGVRAQVVCAAGTAQSAMAAVVLRDLLDRSPIGERAEITSAGLLVLASDQPADPAAVTALAQVGLDGASHRSAQFEVDEADDYDLVLFVQQRHVDLLLSSRPPQSVRERVRLLREFDPVAVALATLDLSDPTGRGQAAYVRCLKDIRSAAPRVVTALERLAAT